jgi:arsenical pump membrane protein
VLAALLAPGDARSAASQDWPPFVLVAGLLLIGLVAADDGLFSAAGHRLARIPGNGVILVAGAAVLVAAVTATLNLDTSVAFLTPVLIYTARRRGEGEAPLLYGCLLLSNAGSLLLPGSNLTNLIVLGHLQLSGGQFLTKMAPAWAASVVVTALVIAAAERRSLRTRVGPMVEADHPAFGVGLVAVLAAVCLVLGAALPGPARPSRGRGRRCRPARPAP